MPPSLQKITSSMQAKKKITGKPCVVFDECNTLNEVFKKYINCINSIDVLPVHAPDKKVHEKAEELNAIVITSDKGFVIKVILKDKPIIFQTYDGNRFYIKPVLIQTDCNTKYLCPVPSLYENLMR